MHVMQIVDLDNKFTSSRFLVGNNSMTGSVILLFVDFFNFRSNAVKYFEMRKQCNDENCYKGMFNKINYRL